MGEPSLTLEELLALQQERREERERERERGIKIRAPKAAAKKEKKEKPDRRQKHMEPTSAPPAPSPVVEAEYGLSHVWINPDVPAHIRNSALFGVSF